PRPAIRCAPSLAADAALEVYEDRADDGDHQQGDTGDDQDRAQTTRAVAVFAGVPHRAAESARRAAQVARRVAHGFGRPAGFVCHMRRLSVALTSMVWRIGSKLSPIKSTTGPPFV